jgi:hypothetical protein
MHTYRLDPALKSLGKRLDNILCDIARLPLSPPIEELLKRLELAEAKQDATAATPDLDDVIDELLLAAPRNLAGTSDLRTPG